MTGGGTPDAAAPPTQSVPTTPGTVGGQVSAPPTLDAAPKADPPPQLPTMDNGTKVLNRFVVEKQLGAGGFGQIYQVKDTQTNKDYVLKWQACNECRRIKLEMTVLLQLRGRRHIPVIFASGTHEQRGFIIMQLLGKNLGDLKRAMPARRFTDGTLYRVAEQMTSALQDVHEIGYLHRDIKPPNICVGMLDKTRVYLIDFGMARNYTTISGRVRKARDMVGFRGTMRYAAMQVHRREEQGPAGDLESLVYTLVEMSVGVLPWAKAKEASDVEDMKKRTKVEKLCEKMAKGFRDYAAYIWELEYEDFPNYGRLMQHLSECFWEGFDKNDLYDWEYLEAEQKMYPPSWKKERDKKKKERKKENADPEADILPGVVVAEPNRVMLTKGKIGELVKVRLRNESEVTIAYRISTTRAFLMSKPHYGYIPAKSSIIILAGTCAKVDKLESEKVPPTTTVQGQTVHPKDPLAEAFNVHFGLINVPYNDKDPRELLKEAVVKGKLKIFVDYHEGDSQVN